MASFNMYHDKQEHFIFIENSGQWFMSLYQEETPFVIIPKVLDSELQELIPIKDICQYEFSKDDPTVKCKHCDNDGFYWDTFDDRFEICECYHGKCHGEQSLEDYIDGIKEAHALRNVL